MITLFVLASTVFVLIVYDIFIAINAGLSQTISWQTYLIAQKYPIIPLALGIVLGHALWVQNCHCVTP